MPGLLVVGLEILTGVSFMHYKLILIYGKKDKLQLFRNLYAMKVIINFFP